MNRFLDFGTVKWCNIPQVSALRNKSGPVAAETLNSICQVSDNTVVLTRTDLRLDKSQLRGDFLVRPRPQEEYGFKSAAGSQHVNEQ